jgi:hypothetical protein
MIAEIYVLDVPFHADRAYTYYIPPTLEDSVVPAPWRKSRSDGETAA